MIDFPAAKNKFSFYLDRKGKRVTIDINSNAKIFSKHLDVPTLNETTTIRSLAISFSQNVVNLYIDCKDVFKDEMEFNLSKLFADMEEPTVKLFRERKYPLFLDGSTDSALDRASCQKLSKRKPNRNIVKDNERKKYFDGKMGNNCVVLRRILNWIMKFFPAERQAICELANISLLPLTRQESRTNLGQQHRNIGCYCPKTN